jgi:hypothetical protein
LLAVSDFCLADYYVALCIVPSADGSGPDGAEKYIKDTSKPLEKYIRSRYPDLWKKTDAAINPQKHGDTSSVEDLDVPAESYRPIKHLLVNNCISTAIASAFRMGMAPVFSAESDPIPNRSDSEPNPHWADKSEPNPNLAWRNRTEPEPGPRQTEPNPNPAPQNRTDSEPRRSHPNPGLVHRQYMAFRYRCMREFEGLGEDFEV